MAGERRECKCLRIADKLQGTLGVENYRQCTRLDRNIQTQERRHRRLVYKFLGREKTIQWKGIGRKNI